MEKRMTLRMNTPQALVESLQTTISNMANSMKEPMEWLRAYYSHCMDKEVSMRQTWLLIQTQAAFILTVFTSCPLLMRAAFATWFLHSLLRCRREL